MAFLDDKSKCAKYKIPTNRNDIHSKTKQSCKKVVTWLEEKRKRKHTHRHSLTYQVMRLQRYTFFLKKPRFALRYNLSKLLKLLQ